MGAAGLLALGFQGPLHDSEDRIVHYNGSADLADPIARLRAMPLAFEPAHGYLASLLEALQIPASSQGLVFSKTSLQNDHVNPRTPRAIYFGDDAYVSWVPGGDVIDISAVDPRKGPIFYTLDQRESSPPHFERRAECTGCHIGPKTLNVPGHLLRSVITAPDGYPLSTVERFTIGHGSPLDRRWGGWYVTALDDHTAHKGSLLAAGPVDTALYLSSGSDMVALLVLAHQVKMHNLMTRAGYETQYALSERSSPARTRERIAHVAEPLIEYMLFRDEAPLAGPIQGTSTFAQDFAQRGPRDARGRSLRELDLRTRLMRYPCSYLIYSEAFDALPAPLKDYIWRRLAEILDGRDQSPAYAGMAAADRNAISAILRDTKPEFAAAAR